MRRLGKDRMIKTLALPNGLTLVAEPQPWQPGASFELHLPAGAATEPAGLRGSTTVIEDWLYRGAGERDSRQISERLDALGVRRGGGVGVEGTSFSGQMLAGDLAAALEVYADVVRRPRLPDDEFAAVVDLARQDLESLDDTPSQKLFVMLRERAFRSAHGRSSLGTLEGLAALTPELAREDYRTRFGPGGAVLGVAGGISWDELEDTVRRLFGDWTGGAPDLPAPELAGGFYAHEPQDTAQVQIGLVFPDAAATDPGWYASRLAASVLSGGGFANRLMQELREKRGLVYSVWASGQQYRGGGALLAYAGSAPDRAQETLDVLVGELARLREGVSADELGRARTGQLTTLVMSEESSGARARSLVRDQLLLGRVRTLDEVRAGLESVTLESLNAHVAEHPLEDPAAMTLGPRALEPGWLRREVA